MAGKIKEVGTQQQGFGAPYPIERVRVLGDGEAAPVGSTPVPDETPVTEWLPVPTHGVNVYAASVDKH